MLLATYRIDRNYINKARDKAISWRDEFCKGHRQVNVTARWRLHLICSSEMAL